MTYLGFVVCFFALSLISQDASAQFEGPYPVTDRMTRPDEISVDFGDGDPEDLALRWKRAWGTTREGVVRLKLIRFDQVCRALCGGTEEACHVEGVFRLTSDAKDKVVAAFLGRTSEWKTIVPSAKKPVTNLSEWTNLTKSPSLIDEVIWFWEKNDKNQVVLKSGLKDSKNFYSSRRELHSCVELKIGEFQSLRCPDDGKEPSQDQSRFLYADKKFLLTNSDYSKAAVDPVATFAVGKQKYYLVYLGLKGYNTYAFLYKDESGWHLILNRLDYPRLC